MQYDAIISVSAGKDSLRQALYARDNLGLNVLLVSTRHLLEKVTNVGVRKRKSTGLIFGKVKEPDFISINAKINHE